MRALFSIVCLLMLKPVSVLAGQQEIIVTTSENADSSLRLEARQASLGQILSKLAGVTAVPIHYSALPDGLITATCVGAAIKPVLECLLNNKADLVYRYSQGMARKQLEEVWVVGSHFASENSETNARATPANQAADALKTTPEATASSLDRVMAMSNAQDPAARADALALLAIDRQIDDATAHSLLTAALSDRDAEVRAQAVDSLARREGAGAAGILQTALQDSAAAVRMMVVDNAGDNAALLQQALADSDKTIGAYAATKLQELADRNGQQ